MSISLTLSICVSFISLMKSVNGIIIFFSAFVAAAVPVFGIYIVPLTCLYASL